jgi:hypothetical protein
MASSSSSSSKGLTSVRVGGRSSSSSSSSSGGGGRRLGSWLAVALLMAASLPGAVSKVVSGRVALNNATQWAYLTKFSYSLGSGNFTLDVKAGVRVCMCRVSVWHGHGQGPLGWSGMVGLA